MSRPRLTDTRGTQARRDRVAKAKAMRESGKTWDEIGDALGVHPTTAFYYVFPREERVRTREKERFKGKRAKCNACGEVKVGCVKFRHGYHCPDCLNNEKPVTIDQFAFARRGDRVW